MIIYFVRHGKTNAHLNKERQTPQSELGVLGKEQALKAAKKLLSTEADVLISSDWRRAIQTAEIISEVTGLKIEINSDLHEQDKPKSIEGVKDDSEVNLRFLKERTKSAEELNFDWKFENEGESLNELLIRAKSVCNQMANKHKGKKVIAVTHGVLLAAILTAMIFGINGDKRTVLAFFKAFRHHNAGITTVEYDEENGWWSLISLNDFSHLT